MPTLIHPSPCAALTRIPYRSTAACFDRNMWIASDIANDYKIATEKNNTPPDQKMDRIKSAVGKINFLLDRGLAQDRSLPRSDVRLVPPSLRDSKLRDMKSALIGSYFYLGSKSKNGKERAFHLYKAHTSSLPPNSLISPAWSTSRKTEALHEASSALKHQYENSQSPAVDDCKLSHAFCKATQESIGLGIYNYSDVTKTASKMLGDGVQSDLTNVFGVDAAGLKTLKASKPDMDSLWVKISSFKEDWKDPEWIDAATDLN